MFGAMVFSIFVSSGTAEAQEMGVATGTEKAQVAVNVEAQATAVTVEKLIAKWAMEKALRKNDEIEVMVEPVRTQSMEKDKAKALDDVRYLLDFGQPIDDPENWSPNNLNICTPGSFLCGIEFNTGDYPLDDDDLPSDEVLSLVEANWAATAHGSQIAGTSITVFKRE